jgi:hypothetical protein
MILKTVIKTVFKTFKSDPDPKVGYCSLGKYNSHMNFMRKLSLKIFRDYPFKIHYNYNICP